MYYSQSASKYFKTYQEHTATETYYTSNDDLSKFDSHLLGLGMKFTLLKGVLE